MSWLNVVFRPLNRIGDAFVEMRKEDGHGSSAVNPTYVTMSEGGGGVQYQYDADEPLDIPEKKVVYFDEAVTLGGVIRVDGIYKQRNQQLEF